MVTLAAAIRQRQWKRRQGRRNALLALSLTHHYAPGDSITTGTQFPDTSRDVTMGATIRITGASAAGVVIEIGDSTTGLKLVVTGGSVYFACGDATPASATGLDGTVALAALANVGNEIDFVVAVKPSTGQARVWANGSLILRLDEASLTAMAAGWSGSGAGIFAGAAVGTHTQRNSAVATAPSDFEAATALRVAIGQLPRDFDA